MAVWGAKALTTREVVAKRLHDAIVDFDRQNMAPILAQAGVPFPEEKRRKAFEVDGLFIVVFDGDEKILGYLELCPDWDRPEQDIYISSLQIATAHRHGAILRCLLSEAIRCLRGQPFCFMKTAVQKNNESAIRMYRRIGFSFSVHPRSESSFLLTADRTILNTPLARRLSR